MKVCINTNTLLGTLPEVLDQIRDIGCLDVELSTDRCKEDFSWLKDAEKELSSRGMRCVCFSAGWTDFARGVTDRAALQMLMARELGAKYIRFFASNPRDEAEPSWSSYLEALDTIRRLSWHRACSSGPMLLIENEGGITATLQKMLHLMNDGNMNFGVVLDPTNFMVPQSTSAGLEVQEAAIQEAMISFRVLYPWAWHVHVKDIDLEGRYRLVGDGLVPWRSLLEDMHKIGYDEHLSLEHVVAFDEKLNKIEPRNALALNWDRLNNLIKEVRG